MEAKTFTVKCTLTGQILTLEGKDLGDALDREALNPAVWVEVEPPEDNSESPLPTSVSGG